jgi:hypothetical protein
MIRAMRSPGWTRPSITWLRVLTVVLGLACEGTSSRGWHDDESSPLVVSIGPEAQQEIRLGNLEKVLAPPVEFAGLVVEDRNHYPPVLATDSGTAVSTWPKGLVKLGDTLLILRSSTRGDLAVRANRDGTWLPRNLGRRVVVGETLGTLGNPGTWIAEGSVGDYQGGEIHAGDPATVRIWGDPDSLIEGTVEWVRRPVDPARGSTTVGVEFPHAPGAGHGGTSALVTVIPAGPGDSVFAAPEEALVRLTNGLVLFLPQGGYRYEVRFVFIGPAVESFLVLRAGVDGRVPVVTHGLDQLKRAAEDSLRLRARAIPTLTSVSWRFTAPHVS